MPVLVAVPLPGQVVVGPQMVETEGVQVLGQTWSPKGFLTANLTL